MDNKNLPEKKIRLPAEVLTSEISDGVTLQSVSVKLKAIYAFQQLVRSQLKIGHDYGIIPGTPKPGLWKPGAEKIAKLLGCADKYEIIEKLEDWDKPLFSYKVKCQLVGLSSGVVVSEGLGECNSMESKYRYRWVYENQIPKHFLKEDLMTKTVKGRTGNFTVYRIDNDDIYSQINTLLKMSKKRALVDASLSAGRLSDLFTQDLEEKFDIETPETYPGENGKTVPKENSKLIEVQSDDNAFKKMLDDFVFIKEKVGDKLYYKVLAQYNFTHSNQVKNIKFGNQILEKLQTEYELSMKGA